MFQSALLNQQHRDLVTRFLSAELDYQTYLNELTGLLRRDNQWVKFEVITENVEIPTIKASLGGIEYFSVTDGDDCVVMFTDVVPYI